MRFRPARRLPAMARRGVAVVCLGLGLTAQPVAQEVVSLDDVLRRVGAYVARFEREMPNMVAEERYRQQSFGLNAYEARLMRSDVGIVLDPFVGWMTLRDVFEVDGRSVRDREDRIAKLLIEREANRNDPKAAEAIVKENSRFNLNPPGLSLPRTINVPTMGLKFVRVENQPRSEFRIDRRTMRDGQPVVRLAFRERAKPRIIRSPGDNAADGTVLVDAVTGEVLETELRLITGDTTVVLRTTYERQPPLTLPMPVIMRETYAVMIQGRMATLEAEATYSRFRTFGVETSTSVGGTQ
jgi:hypothetical protein